MNFRNVRAIIIWCGVPALLITENNLSSGIITCGIVFVVLFVACKIKWPFFACAGAGIGLIAVSPYIGKALVAVRLLKPYQLDRITAWVDPTATDTGYQTLQGLYAIGSGGLKGLGLGNSVEKQLWLPESTNDFIFSVVCEELGFIGAVLIIVLFILLIAQGLMIAYKAENQFCTMVGDWHYGADRLAGVLQHRRGHQHHPQYRHQPADFSRPAAPV